MAHGAAFDVIDAVPQMLANPPFLFSCDDELFEGTGQGADASIDTLGTSCASKSKSRLV